MRPPERVEQPYAVQRAVRCAVARAERTRGGAGLLGEGRVAVAEPQLPGRRAAPDLAAVDAGGHRQHLCRDRPPLLLVGVQEPGIGRPPHHRPQLPAQVVGVLDAGVQALPAGRGVDVRRVPREEDPAGPEGVRQRGPGPEVRGPADLGHVLGGEMGACGHRLPYALRGEVHLGALRELRHHLEVLRARQRADSEVAVALGRREDVPVGAVETGDPDVRHQHRLRIDRLPGHPDPQRPTDGRPPAVGRDRVPRPDRLPVRERDGHPVVVLLQRDHLPPEGDPPAQLAQPGVEDLLRPPLRKHARLVVRRVPGRLGLVEHPVLTHPAPVLPDHPDRIAPARRPDGVEHAQVVEDLHRPRLEPLAARAGEQLLGPLHHQRVHPAPREVHAEGEPGRTRTHDQNVSIHAISP